MEKKKALLPAVVILLIIIFVGLGIWIGSWIASSSANAVGASDYTAVYMTTGDVYFGKLSWFPKMHLTDVWYLLKSTGATGQPQIGIVPFTSSFWGPTDEVDLNANQVLFTARIRTDSQLLRDFQNPVGAPAELPPGNPIVPQAAPVIPVSSTVKK